MTTVRASAAQPKTETVDVNSRGYRERVFEIVRRIPAGRVMTYGQLAEILGEGYTARTVGFVMHAADETVPWQRVINAQGACSTGRVIAPARQAAADARSRGRRLRREGALRPRALPLDARRVRGRRRGRRRAAQPLRQLSLFAD